IAAAGEAKAGRQRESQHQAVLHGSETPRRRPLETGRKRKPRRRMTGPGARHKCKIATLRLTNAAAAPSAGAEKT
ncbi:hypothetical protein, partial [Rhodoblastus sp.]|uniref:hypothetical protein n=1 Tax=Rhodoblastus sp. TaxID=1962975 RepID=UPI003F983439